MAPGADNAAPGMGRGGPGGPPGRARLGGSPAARLLGLRQQLELTDDQVRKLEALAAAPQPRGSAADRLRARADLMEAMQGDGNLTAARAALDKMHKTRTDATIARLKSQQDARAVLTPAQKTRLDNLRQAFGRRAMMARRGQGRPGFGPRGPGNARGQGGRQGMPRGFGRGGRNGPPMGPGMMGPGMMGPGMGRGLPGQGMGRGRGRRGGDIPADSALFR